jgi:hypothetical protein
MLAAIGARLRRALTLKMNKSAMFLKIYRCHMTLYFVVAPAPPRIAIRNCIGARANLKYKADQNGVKTIDDNIARGSYVT